MISASHLTKTFGHNVAVDDLSLEIAAGEIYGLVGPDGAGKTTTMRLLCGAMLPDGKDAVVHIGEYDMLRQPDQARSLIGYLPQRFSLYEDLTVIENLRFFAEVRGLPAAEWQPRCMEILRFVGLDTFLDRRAGFLSGGMKQKLGLAAALAHRPRLLLLDEPTTGVDPVTRQDFWQLIIRLVNQDLAEAGVAVLVSTPYMDEAVRCTRLGLMRSGKLLLEGTPASLRSRLDGRILELRGRPLPLLRRLAEADPGVEDAQMFGDRIHLRVQADQAAAVEARLRVAAAAALPAEGGELTLLRSVPSQLEDVFISLLQ
jgi:ABC-2 type transport system ATP-binding protein